MAVTASLADSRQYLEKYPPTKASATQARHDASLVLLTWHLEPLIESAELIVTELVANAIQHGEGPIEFSITRIEDGVKLAVADRSPNSPDPRPADPLDEGGRGILLVEALATSWGCQEKRNGKQVWAELLSSPGS
ncbi:ATP-binding protein [Streptomyces sp. NPDC000927]|uniref:ATP-binding protein n=1 Tax=Streptomyces sp. NPDC000927 TaxID=3154371 RepID=UPI0033204527